MKGHTLGVGFNSLTAGCWLQLTDSIIDRLAEQAHEEKHTHCLTNLTFTYHTAVLLPSVMMFHMTVMQEEQCIDKSTKT